MTVPRGRNGSGEVVAEIARPRDATFVAAVALCLLVATVTGCSHAMPRDPDRTAAPRTDDDPWRVKGSVTAGPIGGSLPGPYSPRP